MPLADFSPLNEEQGRGAVRNPTAPSKASKSLCTHAKKAVSRQGPTEGRRAAVPHLLQPPQQSSLNIEKTVITGDPVKTRPPGFWVWGALTESQQLEQVHRTQRRAAFRPPYRGIWGPSR
jgi:hypothetical protein